MWLPYYLPAVLLISQHIIDTNAQIRLPNHAENYLLEHLDPESRTTNIEQYAHPDYDSSEGSVNDFKTTFVTLKPDRQILHINQALTNLLTNPTPPRPNDLLRWCEVLAEVVDRNSYFERINVAILYAFHTFILQNFRNDVLKSTIMERVEEAMLNLGDKRETDDQWAQGWSS
ncbi:hypothetical protein PTTG_27780 [Puccinia triticina 1-1 BBBD Race 1]|uniref:Uncharacterized protein n=2 Tax=Puccinia triticina TaxID=208348 RepID=A0A180GI30_PUCT1|nr:uncharacterized protein PtA15_18A412 [Puccinia triticina]OAV92088.1 hypothetical protein PTTG_27780 [Puccinia triticina 1-1 BBBD Race 1]WAQ93352.1 hypothetical protein PtA15_18A412 [Puccinia triticina]